MKTTKKQIIKDMLVKELRSEEQKERLELSHHDTIVRMDMVATDDELIAIADELRKSRKVLTTKAYLLLTAHKSSAARLKAYSKMFKSKANSIMKEARIKAGWMKELHSESDKLLEAVENNWLAANELNDDGLTEAEEDEILAQWEQECFERKEWLAANKLNDDSMEICD